MLLSYGNLAKCLKGKYPMLQSISSVNHFNENKSYTVTAINKDLFIIKQFVNGFFVSSTQANLYNTSEISYNTQVDLLNLLSRVSACKSFIKSNWSKLVKCITTKKQSKRDIVQAELDRKIKTTNFKFIGGLSIFEQLTVIKMRRDGMTQKAIADTLETSRGTVIRILKQKQKVIYIAEVFTRL